MRNLKKILALALALVMSMSLMATANAFTDDDSITDTYDTAVTVLSGLEVFQGYDDGSFQPQGAITRAEVAAIIYRIVTGDVEDTQVGIYADYNKFDDVKSTSWYAGYVNFCANAEYIKGYDAKTFGPNDPVTGYQALAMILRALGYDKNGEFTGTNWQVQTAAVGENRGITKNVTAGTLGVAATREVVAEILFQAIMVETVNYTPAFGYQIGDTSIGYKTFGLEYVTGVVTANEYADLYDTEGLAEGKTRLDVDGEDYTIDYATDLTNMGMAYDVYLYDGGNVLAIADAGNTVFETGEGTEINKSNTGMNVSDAAKFLNFGEDASVYTSDWRIKYVLEFTAANDTAFEQLLEDEGVKLEREDFDAVYGATSNTYTYEISFKAGANISSAHMSNIQYIFDVADYENADYVTGEVYVGTKSTEDASDEMSFKQFKAEYIDSENKDADYDESDNGEWLKVIDNDGDGVADYIFLTEFAMSIVNRITRDDEYVLANLANTTGDNNVSIVPEDYTIASGDVVTEDELAEGDVVIWTLIDGVYYVDLADMVTETVDKKGINSKAETMTCDGVEYTQSHIGYTNDTYYHDVTDAHTEETYDLYLDHFGYIRLFIESDYNTFMLLTDGWYEDDNRTETFQAYYWDVEAEEETLIDVVTNDDAYDFIDNGKDGDEERWGNLYGADDTYNTLTDDYASNIAGYAETDDGYALKDVRGSTGRVDYMVQTFAVDGLKDRYLDAAAIAGINVGDRDDALLNDIQTTTNTQYYLVIRYDDDDTVSGWGIDDVITWTGYTNAPAEADLVDGAVGYAVTHESSAGSYNVADVVVFETLAYADDATYFVYETNNWHTEHVWAIGYDEDGVIDPELQVDVDDVDYIRLYDEIEFYVINENGRVSVIDDPAKVGDYAAHNIYAGTVDTGWDIEDIDYIQVSGTAAGKLVIEDAPIYNVYIRSNGDYDIAEVDRDDVEPGQMMILFTDDDEIVEYAISVNASLWDADDDGKVEDGEYIADVKDLYDAIVVDATARTAAPTVTIGDLKINVGNNNIPYTVWSKWAANAEYTVTPATGNSIAIDSVTNLVDKTFTVAADTATGTQTIVVTSKGANDVKQTYTFTINYVADATSTKLFFEGTEITDTISDYSSGNTTINMLINSGEYYTAGGKAVWTFFDGNGKEIKEDIDNYTTANVGYAEVVVTADNKASKTYIVIFDSNVVPVALNAIVDTLVNDCKMDLDDIANELVSTYHLNHWDVMPAMRKAGVSIADIFAEYGNGYTVDGIAAELAKAGDSDADVLDGYLEYAVEATPAPYAGLKSVTDTGDSSWAIVANIANVNADNIAWGDLTSVINKLNLTCHWFQTNTPANDATDVWGNMWSGVMGGLKAGIPMTMELTDDTNSDVVTITWTAE